MLDTNAGRVQFLADTKLTLAAMNLTLAKIRHTLTELDPLVEGVQSSLLLLSRAVDREIEIAPVARSQQALSPRTGPVS